MDGKNLLIDYIKSGKKLVLFAGAGVSMSSGMPSWIGLTEQIFNKVSELYDQPNLKSMIEPMKMGFITPLEALRNVSSKVYRSEIYKTLEKQLAVNESSDLSLQKKLLSFSSKIITTNYDLSFEEASNKGLKVISYNNTYLLQGLDSEENYIVKLHGDINDLNNIILFGEDYNRLYKSPTASSQELIKLFTDYTIVFVGVSFSDPYLNTLFDFTDKIYDGILDKHFIVTSESTFDGLKDYLVPVKISAYNRVDVLIDELVGIKENELNNKPGAVEIKSQASDKTPVQLLLSKPLDKANNFSTDLIIPQFKNYNVKLSSEYFNSEKIRSIESSGYIFIFTQIFRDQIIIEGENLKSRFLKIDDLNQFASPKLKGVFLVVEGTDDFPLDDCDVSIPLSILFVEKKYKEPLTSLIHKIFVKRDISAIAKTTITFNNHLFNLSDVDKGGFDVVKSTPRISKNIDKKNLIKFVGRKSDQENIITKILALRFENKLLTIKGSGGIGKTTTISKVSIELAERGYFEKGVHFISCNAIKSFENFEYEISQCFDLTSSKFLREQIADTVYYKDRLLILDNFETLIFLEDYDKISELVSYLVDYSIVVTTSRQVLDFIFEDIYELRNLTTDEGFELFKSFYPSVREQDEKILRYDIVEKVLNNNPLAIKLIARGLPSSKDIKLLKEELENDLFKDDDYKSIFESPEDINIEKSNSLFHSINYSYKGLFDKERLAFEILSLFPDGVHMENLKHFAKSKDNKQVKFGDKEIKALDNKSLLENSNGVLKLQSIINRFSDYQFRQRDGDVRRHYYQQAYEFNGFLLELVNGTSISKHLSIRLADANINNYLKCFTFLGEIDITPEDKLEFIYHVSTVFRLIDQGDDFLKAIDIIIEDTKDPDTLRTLHLIKQYVIYWVYNFDNSTALIDKLVTIETLDEKFLKDDIIHGILRRILLNYLVCEGHSLRALEFQIKHQITTTDVSPELFQLGYHQMAATARTSRDKEFFDFEIDAVNNKLVKSELLECLRLLYAKNTLEITQMTYLKSKFFSVSADEIKKLVITNPYTKGLIFQMKAKQESQQLKKYELYEKALDNLYHIKYYYLECLYEYCTVLMKVKLSGTNDNLQSKIDKGVHMSEKYSFRYLLHKFKSLIEPQPVFDDSFYPISIEQDNLAIYVRSTLEKNKSKKVK